MLKFIAEASSNVLQLPRTAQVEGDVDLQLQPVVKVLERQRCSDDPVQENWRTAAHRADHFGSSMASRPRQPREREGKEGKAGKRGRRRKRRGRSGLKREDRRKEGWGKEGEGGGAGETCWNRSIF